MHDRESASSSVTPASSRRLRSRGPSGAWVETTDGQRILDFTSGQICSTSGTTTRGSPRRSVRRSRGHPPELVDALDEPVLALGERLAGLAPDPLTASMLLNTARRPTRSRSSWRSSHRALRGRRAGPQLPRAARGTVVTYSMGHAGTARCAGLPRDARAVRVPLPDPPLRRHLRLTCLEAGSTPSTSSRSARCRARRRAGAPAGGIIVRSAGVLRRGSSAESAACCCDGRGADRLRARRRMFGFELDGIVPDLLAVSKTLGGGVPLAAPSPRARSRSAVATVPPRDLARVGPAARGGRLAVLDVIEEEDSPRGAPSAATYLMTGCASSQEHEQIGEVRGRGLLVGLELVGDRDTESPPIGTRRRRHRRVPAPRAVDEHRLAPNSNCLRMAPPLSVSEDEIDTAVEILDAALDQRRRAATLPVSAS